MHIQVWQPKKATLGWLAEPKATRRAATTADAGMTSARDSAEQAPFVCSSCLVKYDRQCSEVLHQPRVELVLNETPVHLFPGQTHPSISEPIHTLNEGHFWFAPQTCIQLYVASNQPETLLAMRLQQCLVSFVALKLAFGVRIDYRLNVLFV